MLQLNNCRGSLNPNPIFSQLYIPRLHQPIEGLSNNTSNMIRDTIEANGPLAMREHARLFLSQQGNVKATAATQPSLPLTLYRPCAYPPIPFHGQLINLVTIRKELMSETSQPQPNTSFTASSKIPRPSSISASLTFRGGINLTVSYDEQTSKIKPLRKHACVTAAAAPDSCGASSSRPTIRPSPRKSLKSVVIGRPSGTQGNRDGDSHGCWSYKTVDSMAFGGGIEM